MEILKKQISPEANMLVNIEAGKIKLQSALDTEGLDAGLQISIDADYFIDELAKKIPGVVDDAIFAVIKSAIKAL